MIAVNGATTKSSPSFPANSAQLEELRRLLLAPYLQQVSDLQTQITALEKQVADQQALLENLGPMIAESVNLTLREARDELTAAIAPVVGPAIKTQVKVAREDIIDALYPVIGSTIARSITEAMRTMVETIDQNVKKTFSFGSLKRKVKSKVTGVSEGALVLREALPFNVTEAFLIHRESGLLISHISPTRLPSPANHTEQSDNDRDLVSGMLTAIRDFVRESFKGQGGVNEHSELNQIQYGNLTILIEQSRYVYLAVVYAGLAPVGYPSRVREVLGWIHGGYARQLRAFGDTGDASRLGKLQELLYNLVIKAA